MEQSISVTSKFFFSRGFFSNKGTLKHGNPSPHKRICRTALITLSPDLEKFSLYLSIPQFKNCLIFLNKEKINQLHPHSTCRNGCYCCLEYLHYTSCLWTPTLHLGEENLTYQKLYIWWDTRNSQPLLNLVTKPHSEEEIFIHKDLAVFAEKGILCKVYFLNKYRTLHLHKWSLTLFILWNPKCDTNMGARQPFYLEKMKPSSWKALQIK